MNNSYVRSHGQFLCQHTGDHEADRYFYLHDRLGSVRQIIDTSGNVVKYYTYEPFGETIEDGGTFDNPFRFTGQYFDTEINQYYLRARQYDPHIARFTARDPVFGKFKEPLTLHVYLYCLNDPVNRNDPSGEWSLGHHLISAAVMGAISGTMKGIVLGIQSDIFEGNFMQGFKKGFVTGFPAGALPAFFGVSGLAAAAISGGVSATGSAVWDKRPWEQVLASGFAGAIGGAALSYGASYAFGDFLSQNIPHSVASAGLQEDYTRLFMILLGKGASMGANALLWETEEGRYVWNAVCDFFGLREEARAE